MAGVAGRPESTVNSRRTWFAVVAAAAAVVAVVGLVVAIQGLRDRAPSADRRRAQPERADPGRDRRPTPSASANIPALESVVTPVVPAPGSFCTSVRPRRAN
jgi:hypothetical protein